MLSRVSLRNSGPRAVFYRTDDGFEDIVTGSLLKSPPTGLLKTLKIQKSWKRRFFVLKKTSDNAYILKYYKSDEDRSKPQGVIDISTISYIYLSPENHVKWNVIQKMFKCSPEMVLFIRSGLRDYFLIGENKEEMDLWFESIYNILMSLSQKEHWSPEEELKIRSSSDPEMTKECSSIKESPTNYNYWSTHILMSIIYSTTTHTTWCQYFSKVLYIHLKHVLYILYINCQRCKFKCNSAVQGNKMYSDFSFTVVSECNAHQSSFDIMQTTNNSLHSERNGRDFEKTEENGPSFYMEMESVDKDDLGESNINKIRNNHGHCTFITHCPSVITENQIPVEKDVYINQSDLKDSLFLTEVDGKPCISQCLGLPNSGCLFHKGDQILAVNDLQTQNVKEVQTYLSKLLKAQVKITIQRIPGSGLLNSDTCACD
uniref:Pleckstrin homology domain containing S1, tandem duplicate 3 n=1 Tax=Lepisosteus oculatus TaxID=7918 RepID=W5N2J9_LEPOC